MHYLGSIFPNQSGEKENPIFPGKGGVKKEIVAKKKVCRDHGGKGRTAGGKGGVRHGGKKGKGELILPNSVPVSTGGGGKTQGETPL